jgi:hypothetical protein
MNFHKIVISTIVELKLLLYQRQTLVLSFWFMNCSFRKTNEDGISGHRFKLRYCFLVKRSDPDLHSNGTVGSDYVG